ncbi:hypothetical protein ACFSTC_40710 [Nonomuraea ferruginea]
MGRWVHTWTSAPQLTEPENLPPAPYAGRGPVMARSTLRQTVRVSIGGERLRLRFSNAFGGAPLPLTRVTVALPAGGRAGESAVVPETIRAVTFHGLALGGGARRRADGVRPGGPPPGPGRGADGEPPPRRRAGAGGRHLASRLPYHLPPGRRRPDRERGPGSARRRWSTGTS